MHSTFVVHKNYESLKPLLKDAIKHFSEMGEYVTQGERNVIKKVTIEGETFNIKKFKTPNVFQGFVYQFLRKSKAKRSFEYATKLIDCNIKTPFPVGYSETFSAGLKESYYISKHVAYDFDFRDLIHQPRFPDRKEILKQFAAFSYQLHENNINFLDHSPGNTLIKKAEDETYEFYLIDLNRMTFEPLNLDKRMHNLRRLWLSKTMIRILAEAYSILYGSSYDETHTLLVRHSRHFQHKVNSKKLRRRKR